MNNKVIGITGHQDIPPQALHFIQSGIDSLISKFHHKVTCVSSLARGADQLFANSVLNAGGKLHAIIPCDLYEETFSDILDLTAYNKLLKVAKIVEKLNFPLPSEEAFFEAGCKVASTSEILVAIWDGKIAKGKGGTADIVKYAKDNRIEVVVLWPVGVDRY